MEPIYVKSRRICLKSRERKMIKYFFKRFYTPFAFLVWFIVGLDNNTCTNVPITVCTIAFCAASLNAYETYKQWSVDVALIDKDMKPNMFSYVIFASDFIIHLLCIVLSFWWIDDLHTCLWVSKKIQFYVWVLLYIVSIVLHVMQYNLKQYKIDRVTRQAYNHVSDMI